MATIIERLLPIRSNGNGNRDVGPAVSVLTVTPSVAEELLTLNVRNRTLNEQRVYAYARMMKRDEWADVIADICIDENGVLVNGQHCLHAVAKSGKTILVTLKTGLPPKSQDTMDAGRARSVADQLAIEGCRNAQVVAGAAQMVARWRELGQLPKFTGAGTATDWKMDRLTLLEFCRQHRQELEASATKAKTRSKRTGLLSANQIAALQIVFEDYAPEHAHAWFAQLFGEVDECSQPIRIYRDRLVKKKGKSGNDGEWTPPYKYAFAVKSFNAFMAQTEISKFSMKPNETVTVNVPEGAK